jgi:hypothetical protein
LRTDRIKKKMGKRGDRIRGEEKKSKKKYVEMKEEENN